MPTTLSLAKNGFGDCAHPISSTERQPWTSLAMRFIRNDSSRWIDIDVETSQVSVGQLPWVARTCCTTNSATLSQSRSILSLDTIKAIERVPRSQSRSSDSEN